MQIQLKKLCKNPNKHVYKTPQKTHLSTTKTNLLTYTQLTHTRPHVLSTQTCSNSNLN